MVETQEVVRSCAAVRGCATLLAGTFQRHALRKSQQPTLTHLSMAGNGESIHWQLLCAKVLLCAADHMVRAAVRGGVWRVYERVRSSRALPRALGSTLAGVGSDELWCCDAPPFGARAGLEVVGQG